MKTVFFTVCLASSICVGRLCAVPFIDSMDIEEPISVFSGVLGKRFLPFLCDERKVKKNKKEMLPIKQLFWGMAENNICDVSQALERGADVNYEIRKGFILLVEAMKKGDDQIVREIMHYNPQLNVKDVVGCTPLFYAVGFQNEGWVELLLKNGACPDIANDIGRKPIDLARQLESHKIIALIEQRSKR